MACIQTMVIPEATQQLHRLVVVFCCLALIAPLVFATASAGAALIGFDWFSGRFCLYVTAMRALLHRHWQTPPGG
jgi:hypothetical protein